MKIWRVTGWNEIEGPCAVRIDMMQLAETEVVAIEKASSALFDPNHRNRVYMLTAKEFTE